MTTTPRDLFDDIRDALEGDKPAGELEAMLGAVVSALFANQAARARAEAGVVDLMAPTADVREADRALADTYLRERRLEEARRRLGDTLRVIRDAEQDAERRVTYDRVAAAREVEAADIRYLWRFHATGLCEAVARIRKLDAAVLDVNRALPKGATSLPTTCQGIYRPGLQGNSTLQFVDVIHLPAVPEWDAPGHKADIYRGVI